MQKNDLLLKVRSFSEWKLLAAEIGPLFLEMHANTETPI